MKTAGNLWEQADLTFVVTTSFCHSTWQSVSNVNDIHEPQATSFASFLYTAIGLCVYNYIAISYSRYVLNV